MNCYTTYQRSDVRYKNVFLWLLLFMVYSQNVFGQFSSSWHELYGGSGFDEVQKIIEVSDGYILAGSVSDAGGGESPAVRYGNSDYWLLKTDFDGNPIWSYAYGGTNADVLLDASQTADGGFILAGFSFSEDDGLKVDTQRGIRDIWLVKVDSDGNHEWNKAYGGDQTDYVNKVLQTTDGGFIFAGWTESSMSGEVSQVSRGGRYDYWVGRTDANGNLIWDARYGGSNDDLCNAMIKDENGDYILSGLSRSGISGEKSEASYGGHDYWVLKIDIDGNIIWDRTFGGMWEDHAQAMKQASNGVIYIGGLSQSPISGNKISANLGSSDYWVIGLDNLGNKFLDRSFGGDARDDLREFECIGKGYLVMGGISASDANGDKTETSRGNYDYWIIVTDENLNPQWDKTFGGVDEDNFTDLAVVSDGGIMIGGLTLSENTGDITDQPNGSQDGLVAKFDCNLGDFLNLGIDTTVCQFEPVEIDASVGRDYVCDYIWADGYEGTIRTIIADGPMTFSVTTTDNFGCEAFDEININTLPAPVFDLGDPEVGICPDDEHSMGTNLTGPGITFEWNSGQTNPWITVTDEGSYSLTVTNGIGCTFADTVDIYFRALPEFDLGPDMSFCIETELTLNPDHPGPEYLWSTFQTTDTINVYEPGLYSVTITDEFGCTNSDEIELSYFPELVLDLGSDTTICLNDILTIDATIPMCMGCTYLWDDGFEEPTRILFPSTDQTYSVTVTDGNGCLYEDEINVFVHPLPIIDLGEDETICQGDSIDLVFEITSIGPFDVLLSVNGQDTLLIDIPSGHILTLAPQITTVYQIQNVMDGSFFECSNPAMVEKTIFVNETFEVDVEEVLCEGDSIFLQGAYRYEPGIFIDSLLTMSSCDSIIITDLTVNPTHEFLIELTSCDPLEVGIDTMFLTNQFDCDSIIITIVDPLPSQEFLFNETTCDPDLEGIDTLTLTNEFGCDSLIITNTILLPTNIQFVSELTCDELQAGVDTLIATNQYGCDSIILTNYVYLPPDTLLLAEESCDLIDVGIDTSDFVNQYGCDSIVITTTTILPSDTTINNIITCVSESVGSDTMIVFNQFGCEDLIITNTSLVFSDTIRLNVPDCRPENIGLDTSILTNSVGCDSMVIINTVFVDPDTTWTGAITCDVNQVPVDTVDYLTAVECDSIVITTYTYLPPETVELNEFTCDISQVEPDTTLDLNFFGCDSTTITNYTYVPPDSTWIPLSSCDTSEVGVEMELFQNIHGCDSVVITTTSLLRSDEEVFTDYICNDEAYSDTLFLINEFGCDSLLITNFISVTSTTTFVADGTCDPNEVGAQTEILTDVFGCDSIVITTFAFVEGDTTHLYEPVCNLQEVGEDTLVFATPLCDSLVITHFEFSAPDSTNINITSCNPEDVGITEEVLINQIGCDSSVFTIISFAEADSTYFYDKSCLVTDTTIEVTTFTNQFGCDSLIFEVTIPGIDTTYNMDFSCDPSEVFTDTLTLTDFEGCDSIVISGVELYDTFETIFLDATCFVEEVGSDTIFLMTDEGCDSLVIYETILTEMELAAIAEMPSCDDEDSGIIILEGTAGTAPYLYSIDGQNFVQNSEFGNLTAGTYLTTVQDANGCEAIEEITLIQETGFFIDLPISYMIDYGESVEIFPDLEGNIDTFYWDGVDSLICSTCEDQFITPEQSTTVTLTVIDDKGCESFKFINIYVEKHYDIYIPSAFSPNGDGINDYFTVFGDEKIKEVRNLSIFDRWGERVFHLDKVNINQEEEGWDGMHKNKYMNPGVFVYQLEVEFFDGYVEFKEGDLTLLK